MSRLAGTVVEIRHGRARVACVAATTACEGCPVGQGCSWARRSGVGQLEIPAELDGRPLAVGDRLELDADDAHLLRAACRLYLPPFAGLLLAPALLRSWGLESGLGPLWAAAAGLAFGAVVARLWTRRTTPDLALRRA
jgi:positive regulator of sigma E activity